MVWKKPQKKPHVTNMSKSFQKWPIGLVLTRPFRIFVLFFINYCQLLVSQLFNKFSKGSKNGNLLAVMVKKDDFHQNFHYHGISLQIW